jgi:hypothetical protein
MGSSWHAPGPSDHDGSYGLCAGETPDYYLMSGTKFNNVEYILFCDGLLNSLHIGVISFSLFEWSQRNGGVVHLDIIACTELNSRPLSKIGEMYLVRWAND